MTAENERLRADQREQHRAGREVAYHELLDAVFQFALMGSGFRSSEAGSLDAWYADFQHRSHAVLLLSSEPVRAAADRVDGILLKCLQGLKGSKGGLPSVKRLASAYEPHSDSLQQAYTDLVEVMREDVLPASEVADGVHAVTLPTPSGQA